MKAHSNQQHIKAGTTIRRSATGTGVLAAASDFMKEQNEAKP